MAKWNSYPQLASDQLDGADLVPISDDSEAETEKSKTASLDALRTFLGAGITVGVQQAAHGLTVGDVVRFDGADYVLATADTAANSEAVGVVTVAETDAFAYQTAGVVSALSGLTPGELYYLQDDGSLGTSAGTVEKPVLIATSASSAVLILAISGEGGGGSGAWGGITGTLADQTDLQNALDAKANASSLATVATSGDYTDLSNRPTLGSAAAANTGDFATAAQGGKADTALQPGDELTDLASTGATAGHVPKADGNGSISWAAESGGDTSHLLPKLATVNSYAGNRTLDTDDSGAYVRVTAAGTVTLPDGLPAGFQCVIVNATDSATVTLSAATTLTLPTGFEPEVQNRRAVTVVHVGSNVWEVHGALVES